MDGRDLCSGTGLKQGIGRTHSMDLGFRRPMAGDFSILQNDAGIADRFPDLPALRGVRQEGPWATRVSFVYAADENVVYYAQDNDFAHIQKHLFAAP